MLPGKYGVHADYTMSDTGARGRSLEAQSDYTVSKG